MTTERVRTNIAVEQWARKNHFNFYKDFPEPTFNICFSMDITDAYQFAKRNEISPFLVLMYLSSQATNSVDAFKIRLDKQQRPYLLNRVEPSATVAKSDGVFNFCNMKHDEDLRRFIDINSALVANALAEEPLSNVNNKDYQVFYSIVPWFSFTGYKHANGVAGADTPKIVFGKIDNVDGKATMPVSIELHHAIADAIDIAHYQSSFAKHMTVLNAYE